MTPINFDYDYVIIGSGFGGSASALRLTQKGYRVAVIEVGKRYTADTYPTTNWNLSKSLWAPQLYLFGIWRVTLLRHVCVLGASAVGGGSINYANTLYVPPDRFFDHETVREIGGKATLLPYYELAKKMLGVVENPHTTEIDDLVKQTAAELGRGNTFKKTSVGVYFGQERVTAPDPYFFGEGPERTGCELCGGCMIGCRHNAKNSLDKNYLYFAEKLGAVVIPEHKVVSVKPLRDDGSEGYEIDAIKITRPFGLPRQKLYAKGVVFSAGVLGTLELMLKMKQKGVLPRLSGALGQLVHTNNEALIAVKSKRRDADYSRGVAISSSVYPDDTTHIEPVRFPAGSDFFGLMPYPLTDAGKVLPRPMVFLLNIIRHPLQFLRWLNPIGFARRAVYLLVMQTLESNISIVRKRHVWWPFKTLSTKRDKKTAIPIYIPIANEFARRMAKRMGGIAGNNINEVLLDMSTTAHILGGCSMATSPEHGVIDLENRVFGYQNLLVCDGSMIPANLGVNPSLSILALSERAMSFVAAKDQQPMKFLEAERRWGVTPLLERTARAREARA